MPKKAIGPELFKQPKVQEITISWVQFKNQNPMNIVHTRFGNTLLDLLYQTRARKRQFERLLADRPTGVTIVTREKTPEADIKREYWATTKRSCLITLAVMILVFLLYPEHHPTVVLGARPARAIKVSDIPQTSQQKRPPPPPRPKVPLAVEGEEVPDDVTIESTDLDLDVAFDLPSLGPQIGPISDEPLDYTEIDYKPHPTRIVTPEYPAEARRGRKEGRVMVRVLVDKEGNVEKVEVLHGPELFRQAAAAAAWQFRFRPGKHEGERRKVWMVMPIEFSLK